jgi:homoserine trans-succinylase
MARKFIALKQKTPDHLKLARLKQLQKSAAVTLTHNWQSAADSLYAGWLNYIAAQKASQFAAVR